MLGNKQMMLIYIIKKCTKIITIKSISLSFKRVYLVSNFKNKSNMSFVIFSNVKFTIGQSCIHKLKSVYM